MLADALLLCLKSLLSDVSTKLSPKRFTLVALSVRFPTMPVRWRNNFIKKRKGGKKFFLGRRKNTLLQTLVCALVYAACKSVFFVCRYYCLSKITLRKVSDTLVLLAIYLPNHLSFSLDGMP